MYTRFYTMATSAGSNMTLQYCARVIEKLSMLYLSKFIAARLVGVILE